jgi:uncharacterized membrane protein
MTCLQRRDRGATTLEFLLVFFAALIPLVFGTLEFALLAVARHTLGTATVMAARAGTVNHGDRAAMRRALARGLAPLHAVHGEGEARARAYADTLRPDRTRIEIWSPTAATFRDFGVTVNGRVEIPNVWPRADRRIGAASGQSLHEANQLGIRVRICRPLVFPIIGAWLMPLMRLQQPDAFAQACFASEGLPLAARAILHMQSPARQSAMGM